MIRFRLFEPNDKVQAVEKLSIGPGVEQRPHITVATLVEKDGRFLLVKERADGLLVYNQPAGHLESGESLVEAAIRETFEETGWHVEVTNLLGVYQYLSPLNGISYVRHCFIARGLSLDTAATLDREIEAAVWLTAAEIQARKSEWRSPLVGTAIEDYLAGIQYPLSMLSDNQ